MESVSGSTTKKTFIIVTLSGTGEATHDEMATVQGFKYHHFNICINPRQT